MIEAAMVKADFRRQRLFYLLALVGAALLLLLLVEHPPSLFYALEAVLLLLGTAQLGLYWKGARSDVFLLAQDGLIHVHIPARARRPRFTFSRAAVERVVAGADGARFDVLLEGGARVTISPERLLGFSYESAVRDATVAFMRAQFGDRYVRE
ncbi:hypothetical protein HUS23_08560 [Ectothiorhodospiraceae bacterium 2226]|nr:hypothetical protein HUS23_08560 [Ectothiorhodospiraceae bacterium 2226]